MNSQKQLLTNALLASYAFTGDIFTDAPECRHAVNAAKNLAVLANILGGTNPTVIATGNFLVDGKDVGEVKVVADGTILFGANDTFNAPALLYQIRLEGRDDPFDVEMHVSGDAPTYMWCISSGESAKFYQHVLQMGDPLVAFAVQHLKAGRSVIDRFRIPGPSYFTMHYCGDDFLVNESLLESIELELGEPLVLLSAATGDQLVTSDMALKDIIVKTLDQWGVKSKAAGKTAGFIETVQTTLDALPKSKAALNSPLL